MSLSLSVCLSPPTYLVIQFSFCLFPRQRRITQEVMADAYKDLLDKIELRKIMSTKTCPKNHVSGNYGFWDLFLLTTKGI